jgi:hypothetical protein
MLAPERTPMEFPHAWRDFPLTALFKIFIAPKTTSTESELGIWPQLGLRTNIEQNDRNAHFARRLGITTLVTSRLDDRINMRFKTRLDLIPSVRSYKDGVLSVPHSIADKVSALTYQARTT